MRMELIENLLQLLVTFVGALLSGIAYRKSHRPVSYTHLRAHETGRNLVCRLLLEKKKKKKRNRETNKTSEKRVYIV